ncbi:DNA mismatch repair endonuclease MutL [Legionella sp. CNM-4043-24]|uniref:DNA mismatch repair endonuclease MutL n=1 Tax=Legionella sp. CNM-4043-24 TaxID=3421646 RepID=UPI00403AD142
MSMRIRQLSAAVANQIAAGEVIERPASIVKELLENAQDAGADNIVIDIGYGGLNQVKISDNGSGIHADDLPLALAAHATSKIRQLTDLYAITSMGFRGEALASIASVARVSISSRPAGQASGMLLDNQSGQSQPCARAPGTTIDVRDIFYNAPVRKKFLKSERSEFQAIDKVVRCFALGSPEISITLNHNGKTQLQLAAATDELTRTARIARVLGKTFIEQSLTLDKTHAGMRLHGWISDLSNQRSQSDKVWVYLNGRMVKDKLINHAIKQAYEGILHPGRFPSCLLYFTIDPAEVDVNVHPTKHEVRFQQPRYVHDFIRTQLQERLEQVSPIIETDFAAHPLAVQPRRDAVRERDVLVDYQYSPPPAAPELSMAAPLILNEHFAVFVLDQDSYLVDIRALQAAFMLDALRKSPRPLASRPLLVPVYVDVSLTEAHWQNVKSCTQSLGIELEKTGEGAMRIRSLPQLLPGLSIKALLADIIAALQEGEPASDVLFEALIKHHVMDSQTMLNERYDEYLDYFRLQVTKPGAEAFAKPLSLDLCRDVFHA